MVLLGGLNFRLRDALAPSGAWQPIRGWSPLFLALYFLVFFAAALVLGLPLTYYGGYILPHRYGLSRQSLAGMVADMAKGLAFSLPVELAAVLFVYLLLALAPTTWWLWTGLALLAFMVLLANLAPVLVFPLFFKLTPLPEGELVASRTSST